MHVHSHFHVPCIKPGLQSSPPLVSGLACVPPELDLTSVKNSDVSPLVRPQYISPEGIIRKSFFNKTYCTIIALLFSHSAGDIGHKSKGSECQAYIKFSIHHLSNEGPGGLKLSGECPPYIRWWSTSFTWSTAN